MSAHTEQFDLATYREEMAEVMRTRVVKPFQYRVILSFFLGEKELADRFVRDVRNGGSKDELLAEVVSFYRHLKRTFGDKHLARRKTIEKYRDRIDEGQIKAECRQPSGRTLKIMKDKQTESIPRQLCRSYRERSDAD